MVTDRRTGSDVGVAIGDAARLLGVPVSTLRSWESRYGIPPDRWREPGATRRYRPDDLHALRLMRDEIARGQRAATAADAVRALLSHDGPGRPYMHRLLAAARSRDVPTFSSILNGAADHLGLAVALDDVVFPAMRQVGWWWQTGRCAVEHEHLITAAVATWLAGQTTSAPAGTGTVLLTPGPGESHTLGLQAFAALLARQRLPVQLLAPQPNAEPIIHAVTRRRPTATVITSHLATTRRATIACLAAVHATAPDNCQLFYAGNAFLTARNRRGVHGHYLGTRLADAEQLLTHALTSPG